MLLPDEIPNSQPSSPEVSPYDGITDEHDSDEVAASNTLDAAIIHHSVPTETTTATSNSKQVNDDTLPNQSAKALPSIPNAPQPHTSETPHKPLSALTNPVSSRQLRHKPSQQYSRAYLTERISLLHTSLASTHAELLSTLDALSAQIATQTTAALSTTTGITSTQPYTSTSTSPNTTSIPPSTSSSSYTLHPPHQQTLSRASHILQGHVAQLNKYNKIKDAAMGMLGVIAEREAKTLRAVMAERGVGVGGDD